jgi:hypothetical protein
VVTELWFHRVDRQGQYALALSFGTARNGGHAEEESQQVIDANFSAHSAGVAGAIQQLLSRCVQGIPAGPKVSGFAV